VSYGTFRAELIGRVLGEQLTPRQVAEILAEYARSHPGEKGPPLDEIQELYRRGEKWEAHQ